MGGGRGWEGRGGFWNISRCIVITCKVHNQSLAIMQAKDSQQKIIPTLVQRDYGFAICKTNEI